MEPSGGDVTLLKFRSWTESGKTPTGFSGASV
jgi:hypothetical protein